MMDLLICLIERKKMKIILINIILIIFMVFLYKYLKKKTNTYFSPLLLFNWIWITVIVNSALISTKKFSMTTNIFVILIFISGNLFFLMFSKRNNNDDLYKQIHKYYSTNKSKMKKMIIFCLLFRIMQIFYDIYVVNRLGASINMLFGNVEWLRFAYLNYSNNIGIVFALITNILNYFAELGLIISAFLCFCEKKYFYLLINIILSFFHAIFTLSKMAFFIDLIFVIGIFFIFSNIIKINRKEKRVIVLVIVFIILSLIVTGTQRGYQNQDSSIEGIDNVIVAKTVSYFVTPCLAFKSLMDQEIDYSYGSKTFSPIYKFIGFSYETFGDIDVGFDDSTVYTLPGMFFADFGYIGCILLLFFYSFVVSKTYNKVFQKFSLFNLCMYLIFNMTLLLSFFTWMGRMTFYWIFPIFVFYVEKMIMIKNGG